MPKCKDCTIGYWSDGYETQMLSESDVKGEYRSFNEVNLYEDQEVEVFVFCPYCATDVLGIVKGP